ncbi:uncharacterized protein [Ambystoma mexicanum]|uniref:uncharacterized protein isoform X1 n=1 Tax=Ambystoma mexicanum TaxID=8296 RepID=UPI0037E829A8
MHLPSALCACAWLLRELHMDLQSALCALRSLLGGVSARALPGVLHTLRGDAFEDLFQCNEDAVLRNIAGELREALPAEAMLSSEHQAMQKMQQSFEPTVHVDSFLYEDTLIDQLCEEGRMSRHYCLSCGSQQTAPLGFISHSFSLVELKFLFQHALPDLSGKTLVDIGSRLGAVLFGGFLYSSAAQLIGVEMNAEFCELQGKIINKYHFNDRIQVLHADICTQASLLQDADVIVLNNVFEYFLDEDAQISAWTFINSCVCKMGALLVTVPALEESLGKLQTGIDLNHWVEEVQLDYNVYLGADTDSEALQNIHLYRVR